jgi:hypothetical protein
VLDAVGLGDGPTGLSLGHAPARILVLLPRVLPPIDVRSWGNSLRPQAPERTPITERTYGRFRSNLAASTPHGKFVP